MAFPPDNSTPNTQHCPSASPLLTTLTSVMNSICTWPLFFQLFPLDSQGACSALGGIAPLDEGEGPRGDLKARDAAGMNTGAGIVIGAIGMELLPYAGRADVGFEIDAFREGEVFIDGPVGVAGNDRSYLAVLKAEGVRQRSGGPGVKGGVDLVAAAGIVCRPRRVPEANALQGGPEFPH